MDLDPKTFFRSLTEYSGDSRHGAAECQRLLDSLNRTFIEEQVDSDILGVFLIHIFKTTNGLLKFIENVAKNKDFKKPCGKAVEILYTLVNNFPLELSHSNIIYVYSLCSKLIKSNADYTVKNKIFDMLAVCFEKINNFPENEEGIAACKALFNTIQFAAQQKHSDSVKQKELTLLGLYVRKYAYLVPDGSKNLLKTIFFNNLRSEFSNRRTPPSQTVLCGVFTGFMYFWESFPPKLDSEGDVNMIGTLYKCVQSLLEPDKRIKIGNKAALVFLTNHISYFANGLLEKHDIWHKKLLGWLAFGVDEQKVGANTLRSFFSVIGEHLMEKEGDRWKSVVQYFNNWSLSTLEDTSSSSYEKHLAIFCLKQMSEASYKHLDSNEVTNLSLEIMLIFEKTYLLNSSAGTEEWQYLPDYIQTVANLIKFKTFTPSEFFCLQRAVISMIKSFHHLSYLHHALVTNSIAMTLFYLKSTPYFDIFVENIVYQGVIWSCSHQHLANEAFVEDTSEQIVTVKNYFPLWINILKLASATHYDKLKFFFEDRQYVVERVVMELIKTLLVLINKLNISVKPKEEMFAITDLTHAYQVEEANDYAIFLNVIDFYQEIFNHIAPKLFEKSICKIILHLIDKCMQFPLTSGFYKLLSFSLKVTRKLSVFDSEDEIVNQDLLNCQESLVLFLSVLLRKMNEYKDELLIACLQVLLETPPNIIKDMLPSCIVPFQNIFKVGRSYLPLAQMGLNTLQHWQEHIEPELLDPVIVRVIPSLDTFLRSKSLGGHTQGSSEKRRKTAQLLKRRKMLLELEPELVKIQKNILCFIGAQSLKTCKAFVFSDETVVPGVISGQNPQLKITLPYEDLHLDVHLDSFLPRVIDLALYSSDRKSRITACELLQAIVVIFLGKAKPMSSSGLLELNNMLKALAMPLLQLSCDIDQVVRQIFEPLFLQLIHWYTSRTQLRGSHTAIIVEALMEGITHPTNSSLRDFSGRCLSEFVKWTIKQSDESSLERDPVNIKLLVKNMRFFSCHPDNAKRLGAALIFNNIYRELREEEALINIFWLEILHIFINSLILVEFASEYDENITVMQIKNAINHLQRVFVEKASIFRMSDEKRRVPNDLGNGLLQDVAVWLLNNTGNHSRYCRDVCMELFVNVAPLAKQEQLTLRKFVEASYKNGLIVNMYNSNLFDFPKQDNPEHCGVLFKWMQSLLAALDGYNFILKNNIEDIVVEGTLFDQIEFFCKDLQTVDIIKALNLITQKSWTFTLVDKKLFNNLKVACSISILRFYNSLLHDQVLVRRSGKMWNQYFWNLICNVIFAPELLSVDDIVRPKFLELLRVFLRSFPNKVPRNVMDELVLFLEDYINRRKMSVDDIKKNVPQAHRNTINGLLFLSNLNLGQKCRNYIDIGALSVGLISNLMGHFYKEKNDHTLFISELPETTYKYFRNILEFSLKNRDEFGVLISHLYKPYTVQCMDYTSAVNFGVYFIKTFSETLMPIFVTDFEQFLHLSLAADKLTLTLEHVNLILCDMAKTKELKKYSRDVFSSLLRRWPLFAEFFSTDEKNVVVGLEFVKLLSPICKEQSLDIQKWLVDLVISSSGKYDLEIFNLLTNITTEEISNLRPDLPNALFIIADRLLPEHGNINSKSNTLGKMLSLLPQVKSSVIFKFLIEQCFNVPVMVDLQSLLTLFISNSDETLQHKVLGIVYDMSHDKNMMMRSKLAKDVIPVLLRHCSIRVFEQLYVERIGEIISDLQTSANYEINAVNFTYVELLILRLPIGSNDGETCSVSEAANQPKLLQVLMKFVLDAFKISERSDIVRLYKCHAYNALASIVSNSKKLSNFYEKLFVRMIDNKDVLWNGIINTDVEYKFPLFFDSLPKQRKILVSIRDELKAKRKQDGQHNLMNYIESQRLFNSSLSEDITNYDFTESVIRKRQKEPDDKPAQNYSHCHSEIYLDGTEINNHECMGIICGLIQHIFDTGINDLPTEDDEIILPSWMNGIRTTLLNPETHKNVKIFLVKVIDNMVNIFSHFSKWFVEPLLQFVTEKCAGDTVNYFVTDVLVILSKWAASSVSLSRKECQLASDLLHFLVSQLSIERRDVFKYNLDIIKLIVESWKSYIRVPTDLIYNFMFCENKCEMGIHVSSVFLVNQLAPWNDDSSKRFLDQLLKQLKSESVNKAVYRPCAETIGLILQFINKYEEQVHDCLKTINNDRYAFCLEGIAIHFPLIVSQYHISKLISSLNQVPDNLKLLHLKIICTRLEISSEFLEEMSDFKIVEWDCLVEDGNLEIQIITLQIIKKALHVFKTYKSFNTILKSFAKNVSHPNDLYRSCLYDVAVQIYNLKLDDLHLARDVLIFGLMDPIEDNQNKVIKFWVQNKMMPDSVTKRFPFLLSELFKPKIEDRFLGFLTYFIISLLYKSDDYDCELFEHPLEDCDFEDYKLQTNWRLQHPSVVPMFAETLQSLDTNQILEDSGDFVLRQTQTFAEFSATQSQHEQQLKQLTSLDSSLIVERSRSAVFKDPNDLSLSQKYRLPRKRFLNDKSKISKEFAHYETKKQIQKVQKRIDYAKEREKKVTIYRNYRKGDFPDIQIMLSSVLQPLQMLSLQDNEVSKLLFLEIFKGLAAKVENNDYFLQTVSQGIKNIFDSSINFNPNLIGAVLDILLKHKNKIHVSPEVIAYVCQESNLVAVGTLLLEEYIMGLDDRPSSSKMGSAAEGNVETIYWVKLAELYKQLEDWDVVRAIFLQKMNCKESAQLAIQHESEADWRRAQEDYQLLIQTDMSSERKDFYYESYFNCFAHMGEWEKLPEAISSVIGDTKDFWQELLDNGWCQQKLMPWYITSQVKNGLFENEWSTDFLERINSCLDDDNKSEYLKSNFSAELCMMALVQEDMPLATVYLRSYIKYFLEEWQLLDPMFQSLRYQKLLKLRNLIEVDEVIEFHKNLPMSDKPYLKLMDKWETSSKELLPSVLLNETRTLYRAEFLNLLSKKLSTFQVADVVKHVKKLKTLKIKMDLGFINATAENGNYFMARKYLKPYHSYKNYSIKIAVGNVMWAKLKLIHSTVDEVKVCIEAVNILLEIPGDSGDQMTLLKSNIKLFDIFSRLSVIFSDDENLFSSYKIDLSKKLKKDISSPKILEMEASSRLKTFVEKFNERMEVDGNDNMFGDISDAYVKLAYSVRSKTEENFQADFILFVLRAMKMDSVEARKLFPCILLNDHLGSKHKDLFVRETERIPTWMFLGWIPQLLANVDSSKIFAISGIVQKIAETYPQSIMFPYRLSKESYNLRNAGIADQLKNLTNRLKDLLLRDEKVDKFLKALSYVSVPTSILKYYTSKMIKTNKMTELKNIQNMIMKDIFENKCDSRNVESMQGNMFKNVGKYKNEYQKVSGMTLDDAKKGLRKIDKYLQDQLRSEKRSQLLKDYCPWLANFSASKLNFELEIPGQYDGQKLPLPQHHVKISGFGPDISIMKSLRKPIKITILGMDTKEYPFLLKFGEDIRQDQRIEQLFMLMNDIYNNDTACATNGLDLVTYKVIPLTSSLGIIQWINDTEPLYNFIEKSLGSSKAKQEFGEKIAVDYVKWLPKASSDMEIYGNCAVKYNRDKTIAFYRSLVNRIPFDILKSAFWSLSISSENYLAVRNNFIKTYAGLCSSQWILGIGDRHLNNSLICLRNGKVLGIDFGHAFGTATQILPVPELVPIRLTPHIINLMEPLNEHGKFKACMIHTLRALRKNSKSLLATMNVFIEEPSLDWLEHAARFQDVNQSNMQGWYPKKKVEQAKRKLQGTSSMEILAEDLRAGNFQKYTEAYVNLVKGSVPERAPFYDCADLSVEKQVDCLIGHATDHNLLGRMYVGWMPWV